MELAVPLPSERLIGILGLGTLGKEVAVTLNKIGYQVKGWSRTSKVINGVQCFYGDDGLHSLLSNVDILICMLPLTAQTRGILNSDLFSRMKRGAYLINAARGSHLIEKDLLDAIDSGQISGATLDVQSIEPLPEDHPFWSHPAIKITPHIATITIAKSSAQEVAENWTRLANGEELLNVVDFQRQY